MNHGEFVTFDRKYSYHAMLQLEDGIFLSCGNYVHNKYELREYSLWSIEGIGQFRNGKTLIWTKFGCLCVHSMLWQIQKANVICKSLTLECKIYDVYTDIGSLTYFPSS